MVELVVEKPWFEGKPTSLLAMGIFEDKDKDHKNLSKYLGSKVGRCFKGDSFWKSICRKIWNKFFVTTHW